MRKARKQTATTLLGPFWGVKAERATREYYFYPSERARRLFYFVNSVGEAHLPIGFRNKHENRKGFLFHYVVKGEMWHQLRSQTFTARPGDGCLLDLAETVKYGCRSEATHLYWILFDAEIMPRVFLELRAGFDPIFPRLDAKRCREILRDLIRSVARSPAGDDARLSVMLAALLAELFDQRPPLPRALPLGVDPSALTEPTRRGLAYLERFYFESFPLKNVANRAGLSLYHFCRQFRRETGLTPKNFLMRYRIEQAKILLATTDRPVQQIAPMVGILDPEYLATLFHDVTGMTPREYRLETRRKKENTK